MKVYINLFLFFLLIQGSFAQDRNYIPELKVKDNKVIFTEVIQVPEASKEELYLRARGWFADAFKNADEVLQLDSREDGAMVGKGITSITLQTGIMPVPMDVYFTVKIFCKEGRYKYEITNIYYEGEVSSSTGGSVEYHYTIEELYSEKLLYKNKARGKTRWNTVQKLQLTEKEMNRLVDQIKKDMNTSVMGGGDDDW